MNNNVTDYDYFIDLILNKISDKRTIQLSSKDLQFEAIGNHLKLENCGRYVLDINDLFVIGMILEAKGYSFYIWEHKFEDKKMYYIIELIAK